MPLTTGLKLKRHSHITHATSINDISREDIKLLTRLLHLPVLAASPEEAHIFVAGVASTLPRCLRRSKACDIICTALRLLPSRKKPCRLHRPLNRHLISSIFTLVQLEVGERLERLREHRLLLTPDQRLMIDSLAEIKGMWTPQTPGNTRFESPQIATWYFQANKCEACMLSRIIQDAECIRNLRTVLLSRTRTIGWSGRAPQLMRWVDECVECHRERLAIFITSVEDASPLKRIRKEINRGSGRRGFGIGMLREEAKAITVMPNEQHQGHESTEGRDIPISSSSTYSDQRVRNDTSAGLSTEINPLHRASLPLVQPPVNQVGVFKREQYERVGLPITNSTGIEASERRRRYAPITTPRNLERLPRSGTPKTSDEWADEYNAILQHDPQVNSLSQESWEDIPAEE